VAVVDVRIVRVPVQSRLMDVPVRVGLIRDHVPPVHVLVVLVVPVPMGVIERLVPMVVLVTLRQVEPGAAGHERAGRDQRSADGLTEKGHGGQCTEERRQGEVGTGARRSPARARG